MLPTEVETNYVIIIISSQIAVIGLKKSGSKFSSLLYVLDIIFDLEEIPSFGPLPKGQSKDYQIKMDLNGSV